ncbi:PLP-dependent transferase, partial [Crucibulum laeve]
MSFENSLPSILGYLSTMLFNPNNVAFEASPITTLLELDVGSQMCEMLGYKEVDDIKPWGHIACDGTVANLESIWAARNLKFYPFALREAMNPGGPLNFITNSFRVHKCADAENLTLFSKLEQWDLLNLRVQEVLSIPDRLGNDYGISSAYLEHSLNPYIIQSTGKDILESKWKITRPPQYLLTNTKHYSWPKGAALAGIGSDNVVNVPVGDDARVNIDEMEAALEKRFQEGQAVYAVVAIIGSTEEGAVDPLSELVALRDKFQAKGMSFIVHADAAWGGYFSSMIRNKPILRSPGQPVPDEDEEEEDRDFVPTLALSDYTREQFEHLQYADSITIDPHKSGYIPYPAGGLCYRDGRMRYLLTWTAPYINQGSNGESIGVYGVEGSKPGAAAAAVYLHHRVIGLHKEGHGSLLGEVCWTSCRLAAHWATISDDTTQCIVVPLNKLRAEPDKDAVKEEKEFIRKKILGRSNEDLVNDKDPRVMEELRALGSDLNINAFTCNFRMPNPAKPGEWVDNEDVEEANYMNKMIFERLSVTDVGENPADTPLFITSTTFSESDYGKCVTNFKRRLGLEDESGQDLFVMRNVVMSPFQVAGGFSQKLADIFKQTLEDEMRHVVERNTISSVQHDFIMQGTDKIHLVYQPLFHMANSKQQLILSADITNPKERSAYISAKKTNPDKVITLRTTPQTLGDIVDSEAFGGQILGVDAPFMVTLSNIKVVKQRSLLSKWRDAKYPEFVPFYLYGDAKEKHIDHMLLKAPNAQLTAENVSISLDRELSDDELANGALLFLNRHERSMQPFDKSNQPTFFSPGAKFDVEVYNDTYTAVAHGPNLSRVDKGRKLASGTLTLPSSLFVDFHCLNRQDFKPESNVKHYTSGKMTEELKAGWKAMVDARLGLGGPGGSVRVETQVGVDVEMKDAEVSSKIAETIDQGVKGLGRTAVGFGGRM